jgi:hypothetical protein
VDDEARRGVDRLTIQEAARALGISEGAVRKRVTRGTLEHDKGDDERVYVYLSVRDRRGVDDVQDAGVDPNSSALISEMRDRIRFLEEEVQRKDAILLNMTEAMKALSPPSENPPESSESPVPTDTTDTPPETREEPQEAAQSPWWKRMWRPWW